MSTKEIKGVWCTLAKNKIGTQKWFIEPYKGNVIWKRLVTNKSSRPVLCRPLRDGSRGPCNEYAIKYDQGSTGYWEIIWPAKICQLLYGGSPSQCSVGYRPFSDNVSITLTNKKWIVTKNNRTRWLEIRNLRKSPLTIHGRGKCRHVISLWCRGVNHLKKFRTIGKEIDKNRKKIEKSGKYL